MIGRSYYKRSRRKSKAYYGGQTEFPRLFIRLFAVIFVFMTFFGKITFKIPLRIGFISPVNFLFRFLSEGSAFGKAFVVKPYHILDFTFWYD